ncbi:MAG: molybdenum cofactor guanylyltransferase [Gemmatimonadota bacterium]
MSEPADVLGVVLAGGRNERYGSHKALATVGGRRIIDRAIEALGVVVPDVVIVANERARYAALGLPVRPDLRPGLGALGGIHTAVRWAGELGREVALVVAGDMPFLSAALLEDLVAASRRDAVSAPASDGPRGLEPLCAAYGVGVEEAIGRAIERGERAVVSFYPEVPVRRLVPVPSRHGDAGRIFWNVNRPEDRDRAEAWLREAGGEHAAD